MSIRRRVPPDRGEEYDAAWRSVRAAAEARGAHAWRFVSSGDPHLRLEFLEFAAGADPRHDPGLARPLHALADAFVMEAEEEWEDDDPTEN